MKKIMRVLLLIGVILGENSFVSAMLNDDTASVNSEEAGSHSIFTKLQETVGAAGDLVANNIKIVRFLSCALHIPGIAFSDSTNTTEIRLSAVASMLADSTKLSHYLFSKKETRPIIELLWHMPKATLYALADFYELLSFLDAESVAKINQHIPTPLKVKFNKINQSLLLFVEASLRFVLCCGVDFAGLDTAGCYLEKGIEELADLIELWRLFSRCSAYFKAQEYKVFEQKKALSAYEAIDDHQDWEHTLLKMLRVDQENTPVGVAS